MDYVLEDEAMIDNIISLNHWYRELNELKLKFKNGEITDEEFEESWGSINNEIDKLEG